MVACRHRAGSHESAGVSLLSRWGRTTSKHVGAASAQRIVPPWASAMRLATVSPRPMPSGLPVANGSNKSVEHGPVGSRPAVDDTQNRGARGRVQCDLHPAAGACRLDRVEHQIQQQLAHLFAVGPGHRFDAALMLKLQVDAVMSARRHDERRDVINHLSQVARGCGAEPKAGQRSETAAGGIRSASTGAGPRPGCPGRPHRNGADEAARRSALR